ncbi:MAG: putative membrane protein [Psychromonas sp.]
MYKTRLSCACLNYAWHILLALGYLLWSYQFSIIIAAPFSAILMVIHGSRLIFISLRAEQGNMICLAGGLLALTCTKVLLIDMASFEILQKVIAFMVIGAILLSVFSIKK